MKKKLVGILHKLIKFLMLVAIVHEKNEDIFYINFENRKMNEIRIFLTIFL